MINIDSSIDIDRVVYGLDIGYYNETRNKLISDLKSRIEKFMSVYQYRDIMILCIGTDKYLNDSYGPRVGLKLTQK